MPTQPTPPPSTTRPPDDPRLALLRALNTPPYDTAAGKTSTPLNEAVQLIDAHEAAVLRKAALRLYTALFPAVYSDSGQKAAEGVNRAVTELRRMAAEKTGPTELLSATEAAT
jgi:hypothetical protein